MTGSPTVRGSRPAAPRPGEPGVDIFPFLSMDGVTYGYAGLRSPWAARLEGTGRHWCYVVQAGDCWFETLDVPRERIHLKAGDILGVVHDIPHCLRDSLSTPVPSVRRPLELEPRRGATASADAARLLVGSIPRHSDPLSEFFPILFHVPAEALPESRRIASFLEVIESEIAAEPPAPGSASVVRRLSELVVVEFLRVTMRRASAANPLWIGGLSDLQIARLVGQLHAEPGRRWTWESMCRTAGLSRSALDRRFRAVLRQSPKSYLLRFRMQRAAAAIAEGRKSIAEIAESVGYDSDASFHRAFRRVLGVTPGSYARQIGAR